MVIKFPYERQESKIFGTILRPIAEIYFQKRGGKWLRISMIVDSGADITLLPKMYAGVLGIDTNECRKEETKGVGGEAEIYLCKDLVVKIGEGELNIVAGFIDEDIPPLMGRADFFNTFEVCFKKDELVFKEKESS